MQHPQAILVSVDGSETPITLAAATVLSTLLGIEKLRLQNESTETLAKFPKQSLLLLSQARINKLAGLRLRGLNSGVLILSSDPFETLKQKHRILRWGQGSHDACRFPWVLPDLLKKSLQLAPLEPENLTMLQKELKAPAIWYQRRVVPSLRKLEKQKGDLSTELEAIARIIEDLRAYTPVACHAVVEIGDRSAQLQQHFQILVDQMQQSRCRDETKIALLRQTFERWRDLVLNAGEGLGAFS